MARRRMFNTALTTNNDEFHELTAVQRSLYFDCLGSADDEGLFGNARGILSYAGRGTSKKDLQALIDKGYIYDFGTGTYVIADWFRHNYKSFIDQKKKFTPTEHYAERALLTLDENGRYIKCSAPILVTDNQNRVEQVRVEQVRVEQVSLDQKAAGESCRPATTTTNQSLKDILSLWNENPATVNITEQDFSKLEDELNLMISKFGYCDIVRSIFLMYNRQYFTKKCKAHFDWFIKEENFLKVQSGVYDIAGGEISEELREEIYIYLKKYRDWIGSGLELPFDEFKEAERKQQGEQHKKEQLEKEQQEKEAAERAERARIEEEKKQQAAAENEQQRKEFQKKFENWKKSAGNENASELDYRFYMQRQKKADESQE